MATYASGLQQATNEIHTYTIDFTNDLPTGGTVTAGTATHIPPYGSGSSISVSVDSPYAYATLGVQTVMGVHYIDVLATFNDGDKSSVRVPVNVVYPTPQARSGMADIISDLRALCDASADDYRVAGVPYWSDSQLQRILDNHRTDLKWYEMTAIEEGDSSYLDYSIGFGSIEATTGGTATFIVHDLNGVTITDDYTVDYQRGVVTFADDTGGAFYWVTGRSYDLNGAAADVWRRKQSHFHSAVNFSTDGHRIDREQLYKHALEMAEHFQALGTGGFGTMEISRSDTDE